MTTTIPNIRKNVSFNVHYNPQKTRSTKYNTNYNLPQIIPKFIYRKNLDYPGERKEKIHRHAKPTYQTNIEP